MPGCKLVVVTPLYSEKWLCIYGCHGNKGRAGTGHLFNQVGISRFKRGMRQPDAPGTASQGENRLQIVCERAGDGREAGGVFFTLPGGISQFFWHVGGDLVSEDKNTTPVTLLEEEVRTERRRGWRLCAGSPQTTDEWWTESFLLHFIHCCWSASRGKLKRQLTRFSSPRDRPWVWLRERNAHEQEAAV